ncbi:MAG TPA: hypothetical protein VEU98_09350, partial [Candidatus Eremiobacteraceae bacterium]|nr:hypothetical protein [Candidatus Eremiobacteraceae bacterium]
MNAHASGKKRSRLWLAALPLLALAVLPARAQNQNNHRDDDDKDKDKKSQTAPGLFITPTALEGAVQQVLNPGLANYPNFVAGEAVKVVASPDGKTLAILTAGQNSLYFPNASTTPAAQIGTIDTTAS